MITRRAMSLLEVLIAAAMLAMIAGALSGLTSSLPKSKISELNGNTAQDPEPDTEQEFIRKLQVANRESLHELLPPGAGDIRIESVTSDNGESAGEWAVISFKGNLIVRWFPAPEAEDQP